MKNTYLSRLYVVSFVLRLNVFCSLHIWNLSAWLSRNNISSAIITFDPHCEYAVKTHGQLIIVLTAKREHFAKSSHCMDDLKPIEHIVVGRSRYCQRIPKPKRIRHLRQEKAFYNTRICTFFRHRNLWGGDVGINARVSQIKKHNFYLFII